MNELTSDLEAADHSKYRPNDPAPRGRDSPNPVLPKKGEKHTPRKPYPVSQGKRKMAMRAQGTPQSYIAPDLRGHPLCPRRDDNHGHPLLLIAPHALCRNWECATPPSSFAKSISAIDSGRGKPISQSQRPLLSQNVFATTVHRPARRPTIFRCRMSKK